MKLAQEIALTHHEWINGKGYPNQLKGDEIPISGRICSICDVFDALTSPRDYPKYSETGKSLECERMSVSQATSIIEKGAGSHFDAAVVAALKKCLSSSEILG